MAQRVRVQVCTYEEVGKISLDLRKDLTPSARILPSTYLR